MKVCTKCNIEKPVSEFYKNNRGKYGVSSWCKLCELARNREWSKENRRLGYHRERRIKSYGITVEDYNDLLRKQNNKCAICQNICSTGRRLAIDHDHITGQVRGLLCGNCNKALGLFKEEKNIIQAAVNYLRDRQ